MPSRRTYRKRMRKYVKKHSKGLYFNKHRRNTTSCRNPAPRMLHQPIAPKFFTTFECGLTGVLPIGSLATNYFVVSMQPYVPFAPVGSVAIFDQAVAVYTGFGATLVPATEACSGLNSVAFTEFAEAIYRSKRIWSAEMIVTVTPTASADISTVVLLPLPSLASRVSEYDTQFLMSQPRSKCITVTGNNNIRQNTMKSRVSLPTLFGLSKQQYRDLPPAYITDPTPIGNVGGLYQTDAGWLCAYQTYSNVATTSVIAFEVKVRFSCELLNPISEYTNT